MSAVVTRRAAEAVRVAVRAPARIQDDGVTSALQGLDIDADGTSLAIPAVLRQAIRVAKARQLSFPGLNFSGAQHTCGRVLDQSEEKKGPVPTP
jgi:hypothetical protein